MFLVAKLETCLVNGHFWLLREMNLAEIKYE